MESEWLFLLIMLLLFGGIACVSTACEHWGFALKRRKYLRNDEDTISKIDDESFTAKDIHKKLWLSILYIVIGIPLFLLTMQKICLICTDGTSPIAINALVGIAFIGTVWMGFTNGVHDCTNIVEKFSKKNA